ncbi:MAG TPA: hypothetical protein VK987_01685 [Anaerolineae bacterium]|nr:hypothetical protein [Anaerolineae bacterium]
MGTQRQPTAAEALQAWRDAERQAIRVTAQREAADEAMAAAALAEEAARATATAAAAAVVAANEASRAAAATSDAAAKVLQATQSEGDARRLLEQEALAAEEKARAAHRDAVDRAASRYGRGNGE